jgi:hypothetical protein
MKYLHSYVENARKHQHFFDFGGAYLSIFVRGLLSLELRGI